MAGVTAIDHAVGNGGTNGDGQNANPANADPGGMTNDEKQAVGGMLRRDEAKGAHVHVCPGCPGIGRALAAEGNRLIMIGLRPGCDTGTESGSCRTSSSSIGACTRR
jgi:hypothetical protein